MPIGTSSWKQQAPGISWVLWCVSVYEVMTREDQWRKQDEPMQEHHQWRPVLGSPTKTSKANQCQSTVHWLLGYTYTLYKLHMSSQVSTHMTAFRKTYDTTESPRKPEIPISVSYVKSVWTCCASKHVLFLCLSVMSACALCFVHCVILPPALEAVEIPIPLCSGAESLLWAAMSGYA